MLKTSAPFSKPLYVMLKPAGSTCNLACEYCYYLQKKELYNESRQQILSDALLEKFTEEYIASQTSQEVLFTWHGGEPTLRNLQFYKKAIEYQNKYARGKMIDNCIQTNASLLTDEWCAFFKKNNWLVGVSIDGPEHVHDYYRHGIHGEPTFQKVISGIELLNKHRVQWNAMATINNYNANYPTEFYHFFKEIKCNYIQFTPVVERLSTDEGNMLSANNNEKPNELAPFSVKPQQWGDFLCALFDLWIKEDVGQVFIQLFDATLANWMGVTPSLCSIDVRCGHAGVMEFNGGIYSCDHYVFPEYKLGNIYEKSIVEMMYGQRQLDFGRAKQETLPEQCNSCEFLFACNGECPKNRFIETSNGDKRMNYLCEGYKKFFHHVSPYMDFMKKELMNQRAPSNVMNELERIKRENI